MDANLLKARNLLETGDYTCVVCRDDLVYTTTRRGVAPLLDWLDESLDLTGFFAADRVVGRGAAFLYCLLGVRAVYTTVMSHSAAEVLKAHGILAEAKTFVDGIINRAGTGACPFEAAVLNIQEPQEALTAIQNKRRQLQKER